MWWWIAGGTLGAVVIIAALVALVDVVRRRDELTRAQLFAYVILILVIPVVGAVVYALFGRQGAGRAPA
jgi:uncharacterized membrane protein